jgi:hypothetical protein
VRLLLTGQQVTFASRVPNALTMFGNHALDNPFENDFTALFAQDTSTFGLVKLSVQIDW